MEKIHIQQTKTSPEIVLDPETGTASISGESYPENAMEFYEPVFKWLKEFTQTGKNLEFKFKLNYFNTSSSKCIMDILDELEEYHNDGDGEVKVKWLYQEDDDDMQESGEEFADDLELPFELVAYSED
ncbi:MAG: DUF1987 domain-containing protein [Leptospiraceae bacterium]|nr:DUF1987 domain-containing protein [Leptospiraceae bacterium]MCP5500143.1 DUF1987 domain-containing protein [Leptospiraceae bacterium]